MKTIRQACYKVACGSSVRRKIFSWKPWQNDRRHKRDCVRQHRKPIANMLVVNATIGLVISSSSYAHAAVGGQTVVAKSATNGNNKTNTSGFDHTEFLPSSYSPVGNDSYPVLIHFHGAGGTPIKAGAPKILNSSSDPLHGIFEAHGVFVLAPQHNSNGWFSADEVRNFVNYALASYRIDRRRIYLTGYSAGAAGINWYMGKNPGDAKSAAAILLTAQRIRQVEDPPNSGNWRRIDEFLPGASAWSNLASVGKEVPYWAYTRENDAEQDAIDPVNAIAKAINSSATTIPNSYPNMPFSDSDRTANFAAGPEWLWQSGVDARSGFTPKLTLLKGSAHDSWAPAYANYNVWLWLFGQQKVSGVADTTAPSITIEQPTNLDTFMYTGTTHSLRVAGIASADTTQVTWINHRGVSGTANGTASWYADVPLDFSKGQIVLSVVARDGAGNISSDVLTLKDGVKPVVSFTSPQADTTTTQTTTNIAGTASDNDKVMKVMWQKTDETGTSALANATWSYVLSGVNWEVDNIPVSTQASTRIDVYAWDGSNNKSLIKSRTITYDAGDRIEPTLNLTGPTNDGTFDSVYDSITSSGTVSDNVDGYQVPVTWTHEVSGQSTVGGNAFDDGNGNWSVRGIKLWPGDNVITVYAEDAAGNTTSTQLVVRYTPPFLSIDFGPNGSPLESNFVSSTGLTTTATSQGDVRVQLAGHTSVWTAYNTLVDIPATGYTFAELYQDYAYHNNGGVITVTLTGTAANSGILPGAVYKVLLYSFDPGREGYTAGASGTVNYAAVTPSTSTTPAAPSSPALSSVSWDKQFPPSHNYQNSALLYVQAGRASTTVTDPGYNMGKLVISATPAGIYNRINGIQVIKP